jgi:LysM repeat protein
LSFFSFVKKVLAIPFKGITLFIYKNIIINIYKLFYFISKTFNIIIPSERIRPLYIFLNKYISHIIVILLVVSISFANFFTSETRAEGFGEKSVLFALATGGNMEEQYIEETMESSQHEVTSYLETQTTAVSATQNIYTNEEVSIQEADILIADEGSALVKPEFSSIEASKAHRDKIVEYTVQGGDTIGSIAQNFNISTNTILWSNGLSKYSLIKPEQILTILPTSGISHKVGSGDNLAKIAKKYSADNEKIIEFNKLADASDIQVGQLLIIPEGQPYYAPTPRPKLASVGQIFKPTHVNVPAGSKMAWPTTARRISQYFNWRHHGLDIDGGFGDPIWAADDGVITKVAYLKYGYGYHVIIDHGGGKTTLYAHFQNIYVKQGQRVARGDVLGEMGSTGYSTGSHLHFEVRFGSKKYNPLSYIR